MPRYRMRLFVVALGYAFVVRLFICFSFKFLALLCVHLPVLHKSALPRIHEFQNMYILFIDEIPYGCLGHLSRDEIEFRLDLVLALDPDLRTKLRLVWVETCPCRSDRHGQRLVFRK